MEQACVFCPRGDGEKFLLKKYFWFNIFLSYKPVVPKQHLLVIPKRHIESYVQLYFWEKLFLSLLITFLLLKFERQEFEYKVLFNKGSLAGQTQSHFHVHIILLENGDVIQDINSQFKENGYETTYDDVVDVKESLF